MADTKHTHEPRNPNQTMQREQAKAEVSGQKPRQDERDKLDQQRHQQRHQQRPDQSPFGGSGQQPASRTGEPGRARSELDQRQEKQAQEKKQEPAGEQR